MVCLGVICFFVFVCFVSLIVLLVFIFLVRFVVNCFELVLRDCMMISFGYLVMLGVCGCLVLWCLFCLLSACWFACYLLFTLRLLCLRLTYALFDLVSNCVSLVGLPAFRCVDFYAYVVCLLCYIVVLVYWLVAVVVLLVIVLFLFEFCLGLVGLLLV